MLGSWYKDIHVLVSIAQHWAYCCNVKYMFTKSVFYVQHKPTVKNHGEALTLQKKTVTKGV